LTERDNDRPPREVPPRFRWRRPIHGGAGYERMPDGCIWSGLVWFAGGVPTFAWIIVHGWPGDAPIGEWLGALVWLAAKAVFFAAVWPVYWLLQIF